MPTVQGVAYLALWHVSADQALQSVHRITHEKGEQRKVLEGQAIADHTHLCATVSCHILHLKS